MRDKLVFLGSPLGAKSQADLLGKKEFVVLEKMMGANGKLDAQYGFYKIEYVSVYQSFSIYLEPAGA